MVTDRSERRNAGGRRRGLWSGVVTAVTGATGFVGHACAAALAAGGEKLVCTVRARSDTRALRELGVALAPAALDDVPDLAAAFAGCRAVVHCAARAGDWGTRADFERDNVAGTVNVVEAAARAGAGHVVHVSTANAGGYGRDLDEDSRGARVSSPYSRSKLAAERAARLHALRRGVWLTILRPSAVYGPGDRRWTLPMLERIDAGIWPLLDGGRALLTPLYVGNLAQAAVLALECGVQGTFILTDDVTMSWRQFTARCARALGVRLRARSVPYVLARPAAEAAELLGKMARLRHPPPVTRYRVIRAAKDFHYRCDRARSVLGYRPDRDVDAHLRACADWYRRTRPA